MQLRKDFWRCGIVAAPLAEIVAAGTLDGWPLHWIGGGPGLRYLADPFGLWRDGRLYVFAELFDYRDASGRIAVSVFDAALRPIEQRVVLREAWHLSYPFIVEAEGETWMLPEAYQSKTSWLYRAVDFPHRWERVARLALDHVPLDATPFHDGERWWLFYAPAAPPAAWLTELCAAHAERLEGPWQPYRGNPVLVDPRGARPGGTPFRQDGRIHLPVQSCEGTYGAAVRLLRFDALHPDRIAVTVVQRLDAPRAAAPFVDGCHTLAAAGAVTLIDVKRTAFSAGALAARPLRGAFARARARAPLDW